MTEETTNALEKAAAYVASTETCLAEIDEKQASFVKQATMTAAVLSDRGIMLPGKADEFVDKVAADPSFALQFLEKVAKLVQSEPLGGPSDKTSVKVAEDETCPFIRTYFDGDSQGMID